MLKHVSNFDLKSIGRDFLMIGLMKFFVNLYVFSNTHIQYSLEVHTLIVVGPSHLILFLL